MSPSSSTTSSRMHIIPLPHPLVLLPSARVTFPISFTVAEALFTLIDNADTHPTLAAIPVTAFGSPNKPTAPLNQWGVSARIIRLAHPASTRSTSQPHLLTLHGLARVRLTAPADTALFTRQDPLPMLEVEQLALDDLPTPEAFASFRSASLRLLERLAHDTQQPRRREQWKKTAEMVEDLPEQRAGLMADALVAAVNAEHKDKLEFLSAADVNDRLKCATTIFIKQASISEVSTKIASAIDESLSKQQKELFLRQQLAAIQAELNSLHVGQDSPASELDQDAEGEDELAEVKRKISAMEVGSEERRVGVGEWRRLKRIPQQSAEYGVVRNYLDWLTSLPWPYTEAPSSSPTGDAPIVQPPIRSRAFLANAQRQLDADHFGLDRVKRRLIEYLAVVRLREMQAAEEEASERARAAEAEAQARLAIEASKTPEQLKAEAAAKALVRYDPDVNAKPTPKPVVRRRVRRGIKGPILLFVGPPGTGKTSLGQSIAKALDRPFQRIALGGVRDEGEIRGHRRTYVASGPGLIVQALRKAGRADPVLLLDEIDKVAHSNFQGDPAAALLEVLDPEQNHAFNDHYMNVPIDLSRILFICTANSLDTMAAPLLDRCEIIQLSGYTYDEKLSIARRFLLPKQLKVNGLSPENLTLTEPALLHIVTHYTREAGVRSLERAIGSVVRFKAVEWAEHIDTESMVPVSALPALQSSPSPSHTPSSSETAVIPTSKTGGYRNVVEVHELEAILGIARWDGDEQERELRRGVVYGLVVTGMGEGEIMPVETIAVPGSGKLLLTGSLGAVIKESGEIALSWVKTHAYELGITNLRTQDPLKVPNVIDVHLHLPAGAQKKDGPSAGIAMTCAFVSLLTGACVPPNIAMTGEITLRGRVTPVGGVKEKVLGAHRAQITKVILPWANRKDVKLDVPDEVRNSMEFVFVRTVQEALEAAFGQGTIRWQSRMDTIVEGRL